MSGTLKRLPVAEILILLLAVLLRFAVIESKPAHFDEGVNGWFADRIAEQGYYEYDPTNYHGPLHMVAVFVSQTLLGRNLIALRLPSILAGLACVWMAFRFGRFLGRRAVVWAALAMAVSPAMVFYARYSIHESWLVFFLMVFTWGIFHLYREGSRAGLFAIAGAFAGMVLTKETYAIHLGCFALAVPCLLFWNRLVPCSPPMDPPAARAWTGRDGIAAAAASLGAIVFLYSGTFMHWEGVPGLWTTFAAWFDTGLKDGGHTKADHQIAFFNYYWLDLMVRYEWPALVGLAACIRLLWPAPAVTRYLAIYGAGALLAYTIIPYKTPWLIISMLWPFFLIFGWMVENSGIRRIGGAIAAGALAGALFLSLRLNFFHSTDPGEPYVYVQTFPEIREFTDPLLKRAGTDPRTYHLPGKIFLDSYYPLPWMLGDFTAIAYYKELPDLPEIHGAFIAGFESDAAEIERRLSGEYFRRSFRLREGMEPCVVWFRANAFPGEANERPQSYPKNP